MKYLMGTLIGAFVMIFIIFACDDLVLMTKEDWKGSEDTGQTENSESSGSLTSITAFSFTAAANSGDLSTDVAGVIMGTTITLAVPFGTPVTSLIASFATTGVSLTVSAVPQVSGTTANNFSSSVTYTVTGADSSTRDYTVTVNVGPAVTVNNISNNSRIESGFIIGTATSASSTITAVEVSFDGGAYTSATGTTSWKIAIPNGAATWKKDTAHTVNVRSRDANGVYSTVVNTTIRKANNKDVNGDGYADLGVGGNKYNSYQGRAYIHYGSATGISTSAGTIITGEGTSNQFGVVTVFGDLNGDGYADFIIGSTYPDNGAYWGRVYIFYGSVTGIADAGAGAADFILWSETDAYWAFSTDLATGDANCDGYSDLAVGGNAKVYIFHGGPGGISGTSPKRANLADVMITSGGDLLGKSIAFGDINGDDAEDIAIGARMFNTWTGRVFVIENTGSGIPGGLASGIADSIIFGEAVNNSFGESLVIGDIDNDNVGDLVVGALGYNGDQGRVYFFYGSGGGVSSPPDSALTGGTVGDKFGDTLAMGDVNKDGFLDLGVGAINLGTNYIGQTYVYLGTGTGINPTPDKTYVGSGTWYYMGAELGFTDGNGDGYADLMASEYGFSTSRGRILIFNGSASGTSATVNTSISGETTNVNFGYSLTP